MVAGSEERVVALEGEAGTGRMYLSAQEREKGSTFSEMIDEASFFMN